MQVTPTSRSPTQHTYASAGTYYATVTVTDQSGATVSRTVVETVTNPAPTMTSLTPTSTPIGSSPTVTVSGSGFVPGSTVEWDGSPLTTTYVSRREGQTLTAQVPATDTASATVGDGHRRQRRRPAAGRPTRSSSTLSRRRAAVAAANLATSTSATGSATASVGGSGAGTAGSLSAAASGAGTVAVAQYSADPVTTTPPTAVNAYFDVFVPASSSFTSVQVTDCDLAGGSVVYYYDATTTQWAEVPGQTYNASTGCVTFTLGTASTPSLAQLSGTIFGVQDVPPSLSLPGDQSVAYHGALSFSVSASDPQPNAPHAVGHRLARRADLHGQRQRHRHGDGHGHGRSGHLPGYRHGQRRRGEHHVAANDHHRDQGGHDADLHAAPPSSPPTARRP